MTRLSRVAGRTLAARSSRAVRRSPVTLTLSVIASTILVLGGCGSDAGQNASSPGSESGSASNQLPPGCELATPTELVPVISERIPHDPTSYVQGLVIAGGVLYESSGRYGESALRALNPKTGEVRSRVDLPENVFGEGLALADDGVLVQLTWREGRAYRWRTDQIHKDGTPDGVLRYDGEGWGLTTLADGTLLMSDGSDRLVVRDPGDFATKATRRVRRSGGPADQLNELEFDGTWVWANRYQTDEILRIDPMCWTVTGVVDAKKLTAEATSTARSRNARIDVLNGIAHIPGGDHFLVTGKWWPTMFEVTLDEK